MDLLLTLTARVVVAGLNLLPLPLVARIGRIGGLIAWRLDRRHRKVALTNLEATFPDKSKAEILQLTREHFARLGENYTCAARTARMTPEQVAQVLDLQGFDKIKLELSQDGSHRIVVALGHFGNFELYARTHPGLPDMRLATTYRGLRQPRLSRFLRRLRERSGCLYFDRRHDGPALRAALAKPGIALGLLADQHAGDRGLRLPFLGRETSCSAAPAVFARRFDCRLFTMTCQRTALARWRIELGDEIPVRHNGRDRSTADITADINAALEAAIHRDPANWFWVHNRWKTIPRA